MAESARKTMCCAQCIVLCDSTGKKPHAKSLQEYFFLSVYVLSLQKVFLYPGLHPMSHCPVCLLHTESSTHWPLQLFWHLIPNVPSEQAAKNSNSVFVLCFSVTLRVDLRYIIFHRIITSFFWHYELFYITTVCILY